MSIRAAGRDAVVEAVIAGTSWRVTLCQGLYDVRGACRADGWALDGYDYLIEKPDGGRIHVQLQRYGSAIRAGFSIDGLTLHYDRLKVSTPFTRGWPIRLGALLRIYMINETYDAT